MQLDYGGISVVAEFDNHSTTPRTIFSASQSHTAPIANDRGLVDRAYTSPIWHTP